MFLFQNCNRSITNETVYERLNSEADRIRDEKAKRHEIKLDNEIREATFAPAIPSTSVAITAGKKRYSFINETTQSFEASVHGAKTELDDKEATFAPHIPRASVSMVSGRKSHAYLSESTASFQASQFQEQPRSSTPDPIESRRRSIAPGSASRLRTASPSKIPTPSRPSVTGASSKKVSGRAPSPTQSAPSPAPPSLKGRGRGNSNVSSLSKASSIDDTPGLPSTYRDSGATSPASFVVENPLKGGSVASNVSGTSDAALSLQEKLKSLGIDLEKDVRQSQAEAAMALPPTPAPAPVQAEESWTPPASVASAKKFTPVVTSDGTGGGPKTLRGGRSKKSAAAEGGEGGDGGELTRTTSDDSLVSQLSSEVQGDAP